MLFNEMKIIYSLFDYTGNWSKPYKENGYDVRQVDIKHGDDVRLLEIPNRSVYGVLAAPPCTEFAGSGARWWAEKDDKLLLDGLELIGALSRFVLITKPVFWVVENPVGRLNKWFGEPKMYFDPCDYGDQYTKRTGLWGKFKKPMKNRVEPIEGSKMALIPPCENRQELRSETPLGFAYKFYEANK